MKPAAISPIDVMQIARVCHEANRAYCETIGDSSEPSWKDAPAWQRQSARNAVMWHWAQLEEAQEPSPRHIHEAWVKEKQETGWSYGAVKDESKKEHPCLVPYEHLPETEKLKDHIFSGIVKAFFLRQRAR
ncbi:MAG TPA: RyR domain-containing protein [Candidatus Acidoferrum sp.]|nr:RyR domain-containing protein [Candidatus Acidoferrum sp.]